MILGCKRLCRGAPILFIRSHFQLFFQGVCVRLCVFVHAHIVCLCVQILMIFHFMTCLSNFYHVYQHFWFGCHVLILCSSYCNSNHNQMYFYARYTFQTSVVGMTDYLARASYIKKYSVQPKHLLCIQVICWYWTVDICVIC